MDDVALNSGLCQTVCEQSGWLGELIVLLLLAARTLYVQWRNRQLKTHTASLEEKVRELSLRPPAPAAIPVTLQLAPNPGAHDLLGAAVSLRPSDPAKYAQNETSTDGDSPETGDPDWVAPPPDES